MTLHSAQIDSPSVAQPPSLATSQLSIQVIAAVIVVAVALCDFATFNINFAIIYLIPLLMISRLRRPRALWNWTIALSLLAFLGYFAGTHGEEMKTWGDLMNFRVVNRSMEVVALVCAAALLHIEIGLLQLIDYRSRIVRASDVEEHAFDQIIASFDRFATSILCLVLIALVTLTDVITPPQYNIPMLFALPMIASARLHKRWIIWTMLPLLLLLAAGGLYLGPRSMPIRIKDAMIINRIIACLVLVGVAMILHLWNGSPSRSTHA